MDNDHLKATVRRFHIAAAGVCLLLCLLFTGAVYACAWWGGPFVDRASLRIGEVVALRAKGLEDAGRSEEAIRGYRAALAVPFDDPRQRDWTLMRFGALLVAEKRFEEAVDILTECLRTYPDPRVYRSLCAALMGLERYQEAADRAEEWRVLMERQGQKENAAQAEKARAAALAKF